MPEYFVGDGPYVVKKLVINGDATMVENPDYINMPGQPPPGNVEQTNLIPSPTVPVEDFESGASSQHSAAEGLKIGEGTGGRINHSGVLKAFDPDLATSGSDWRMQWIFW